MIGIRREIRQRVECDRLARRYRTRDLGLATLIRRGLGVGRAAHRQQGRARGRREAAGGEKPQPILDDEASERALVRRAERVRPWIRLPASGERHRRIAQFERRLRRPGGVRQVRPVRPQYRLPPLFVIALTTPPVNRPESADKPDVSTAVSSIASPTTRFCGDPKRRR